MVFTVNLCLGVVGLFVHSPLSLCRKCVFFSFFFSEWERGGGAVGHELIYTTHDRGFRVSKTELRKITVNFLELSFSKHLVISLY